MSKEFQVAVFLGRFQVFHLGHLQILRKGLEISDSVLVILGSSNKPRTPKDPFTATERQDMILANLDSSDISRVQFVCQEDSLYNDHLWLADLQNKVETQFPKASIALLGSIKKGESKHLELFPQWVPRLSNATSLGASQIRPIIFDSNFEISTEQSRWEQLKEFVPLGTFRFLLDFITDHPAVYQELVRETGYLRAYKDSWATAPYTPIFVTVDAVVIRSGHVLVIRRGRQPGKNLLALPGGFLDAQEALVDACLRELREETRIQVPMDELKKCLGSPEVFSHPARSLRGRTITHAFPIDLGVGCLPQVKADDDASEALWIPFADVYRRSNEFFEDHASIAIRLMQETRR
jgi:bifunctional NMN adenylyltransferase/nudix hydrolase